jgi:Uncharacterised protein family (UPF0158)
MKRVNIDFDYLIFAYQDDSQDNIYYLDTEFGDIRLVNRQLEDLRDLTDEIELSMNRFLYIPKPGKGRLLADLKIFAQGLEDQQLKKTIKIAFESPHVFEAFKKILSSYPDILKRLDTYLYESTKREVMEWLAANAIEPVSTGRNAANAL